MTQNNPNYRKWVSISEIYTANWFPNPHSLRFPMALISYWIIATASQSFSPPLLFPAPHCCQFSSPRRMWCHPPYSEPFLVSSMPARLQPNHSAWVRALLNLALWTSLQPHFCFSPILLNVGRPRYITLFPAPTLTYHVHVSLPLLTWALYLECFLFSSLHGPAHLWRANLRCLTFCEAKVNQSVFCAISHFVHTRKLPWQISAKTHSMCQH